MVSNIRKEGLKEKPKTKVSQLWGLSKLNYLIFVFGLILIFFGYIIMAAGEVNSFQSLTLAPIFLFLGYIVLIPLSLIINVQEN